MKAILKHNTIGRGVKSFILILMIYGCSQDFLEEKVDSRTLITTLEDMDATIRGLNPDASALFTEFMTDDYAFRDLPSHTVALVRNQIAISYTFRNTKESLENSDYSTRYFNSNSAWIRYYYKVQNTLLVISRASKYNPKSSEEEKKKESIIGRALAIKAYCNFMLVNLFAKPYISSTASKDSGIPLVLGYTGKAVESYPIASVKDTYDNIEEDLLKALTMLDDNSLDNKKYNFTIISVRALLSRLYLYKHDWENAVKYADLVIAENDNILDIRKLTKDYINEYKYTEYGKPYFDPDNRSYLLMSENTTQFISYFWTGFYPHPLQTFMVSKGRYSRHNFIRTSSIFGDIVPIKTVFFFNSSGVALTGNFPLLSVDEVYYNRAEANIQLGNLGKAKEDLKLLLAKDSYYNTIWTTKLSEFTDKEMFINYLLDSKRMRFYGEGMRWFDMRRHSIPITHYLGANSFKIDGKNPEDYAIKFPLEEIDNQN